MATKWDKYPALDEDVVKNVPEDIRKGSKGRNVDSSDLKGGAKESVREAGARADRRNLTRAGLASMALQAGYGLGREIDERTGIGRKMVDKAGSVIDELAAPSSERVKLSPEAQRRVDQQSSSADNEDTGNYDITTKMKKGGKVKARASAPSRTFASKRADGIATKGHTKGKYL